MTTQRRLSRLYLLSTNHVLETELIISQVVSFFPQFNCVQLKSTINISEYTFSRPYNWFWLKCQNYILIMYIVINGCLCHLRASKKKYLKTHKLFTINSICLNFIYLFLFFWLYHAACGTLVPRPGIKPISAALEMWSLNHWATREVLIFIHNLAYAL